MMFTLTDAVLVRSLTSREQTIFEQHGCVIEPYPSKDIFQIEAQHGDKVYIAHRVQFPDGCTMKEQSLIQYQIVFPDNYVAHLVWLNNTYHLYAARGNDGQYL